MDGGGLYRVVEEYEALGIHRAGTTVDRATFDWYESHLQRLGLRTERVDVPFGRYDFDSELTADHEPVKHLPLFYEWTGSVDTTDVHLAEVDPVAGRFYSSHYEATEFLAQSGAAAAVLATTHPGGSLVASNRTIVDRGGLPTVLVAGRDHARLAAAHEVRLRMNAHIVEATTENLIARNDVPGTPLLLTTPLSGWFRCSGERGTGAAVLLDLIERFSAHPLLVVATGGHELDYVGVRAWVADGPEPVAAIAHIGASVGCDEPTTDGDRRLIAQRIARTDAEGPTADTMGAALATANYRFIAGADDWSGESEVLCELGVPMLSVTGAGVEFHTPEDTTGQVTSPTSLALASRAIGDALDSLISSPPTG